MGTPASRLLENLQSLLFWIFLFGVLGLGAELLLLGHTEDNWQWVPLILLALSIITLFWSKMVPGDMAYKAFNFVMILFSIGGVVGLWLHFEGNMEFELEMYPSMSGYELIRESLTGATPALSPGAMIVFGLIGWAYSRAQLSSDPT